MGNGTVWQEASLLWGEVTDTDTCSQLVFIHAAWYIYFPPLKSVTEAEIRMSNVLLCCCSPERKQMLKCHPLARRMHHIAVTLLQQQDTECFFYFIDHHCNFRKLHKAALPLDCSQIAIYHLEWPIFWNLLHISSKRKKNESLFERSFNESFFYKYSDIWVDNSNVCTGRGAESSNPSQDNLSQTAGLWPPFK